METTEKEWQLSKESQTENQIESEQLKDALELIEQTRLEGDAGNDGTIRNQEGKHCTLLQPLKWQNRTSTSED